MKKLIFQSIGLYLNGLALIAPRKAARLGFSLFCHPFRVPMNAKQRAFLATARQAFIEYNGIKIQAYQWGNGLKNILLLHGWQSHTYRWKKYIESLSKTEYTIHAFDAPGHGLSGGNFLSVPLYSEVIEYFMHRIGNIEAIISHSIGSFSVLYTFHRNPALSSGNLVTLASPGEAQEFFESYKKSLALSVRCVRLIVNRFEDLFQKTPRDFSAPCFAATLNVRGLIIHDEEDDDTSVNHSKRIHAAWKNSRLMMTKGFGHNLRSNEVVTEVIRFVNQSSPAHSTNEALWNFHSLQS